MSEARILVIDDEPAIRRLLRITLGANGYTVIEAETGKAGTHLAAQARPDVVILDLGLPDIDGQSVLRSIREWSQVPVLVLSVRESAEEKVSALDAGANDYVTKPFSTDELMARIRALLRIAGPVETQPSVLEAGGICMDVPGRTVSVDGVSLHLTKKEFELLRHLMVNAGRVLTHDYLLLKIWGPAHLEDIHYLRAYMNTLRHKIGDDPAFPRFIRTEAGVGYVFVARKGQIETGIFAPPLPPAV